MCPPLLTQSNIQPYTIRTANNKNASLLYGSCQSRLFKPVQNSFKMNETDLIAPDGVHDEDARLFGGRNEQPEDHFVADLQNKDDLCFSIVIPQCRCMAFHIKNPN